MKLIESSINKKSILKDNEEKKEINKKLKKNINILGKKRNNKNVTNENGVETRSQAKKRSNI